MTPTRSELINYTIVVLVFVTVVMLFVVALDWVIGLGVLAVAFRGPARAEVLVVPGRAGEQERVVSADRVADHLHQERARAVSRQESA